MKKDTQLCFPQIDCVDRITLRTQNLPTNPRELLELIKHVYKRRNEMFEIEEVYQQFVKAHGRITFDPTQKWPQCYTYTHSP